MSAATEELVGFLIANGVEWVSAQRTRHRAAALQLDANIRRGMEPFFAQTTLDSVRVLVVPEIENPEFYSLLSQAGHQLPIDFRQMAGITFDDVVLIAARNVLPGQSVTSLIFHELVHVVQYSLLGVAEFTRRYVVGWASSGFEYDRIPLEQDAYGLQMKFDQRTAPASVEGEVARLLGFSAPAT